MSAGETVKKYTFWQQKITLKVYFTYLKKSRYFKVRKGVKYLEYLKISCKFASKPLLL